MKAIRKKKAQRHNPLDRQIEADKFVAAKRGSKVSKGDERALRRDKKSEFVEEDLSRKILHQAREQLEEEEGDSDVDEMEEVSPYARPTLKGLEDDSSDEEQFSEDEEHYLDDVHLDEADEKALEMFMGAPEAPQRKTLADIVLEKLRASQAPSASATLEEDAELSKAVEMNLDPKVVEVYKGVATFLKSYRSGKLPKAFKIIPALSNWEEVVFVTNPDEWSPQAMYQATRVFASNLNAKMAQRFYNLILLPRIRDDMHENRKLNFHLYQAVRKSLYKPAAFYKGILLPMCDSKYVTLREAVIIGSVISKTSIPLLHSSAALLKLARMEYTGANSLFIRILLEKKYALPYQVLSALVNHFLAFGNDPRQMPVLWHQSLLSFAQRYKNDINNEQREALRHLTKRQMHYLITDEVRRELNAGVHTHTSAAMET